MAGVYIAFMVVLTIYLLIDYQAAQHRRRSGEHDDSTGVAESPQKNNDAA